jgi:hypothetical protein
MVRQVRRDKGEEDKMGTYWTVVFVIGGAVMLLFVVAAVMPRPTTQNYVSGVKFVSEFPLDELSDMKSIALYNTTATPAELTCKLELSAISQPDRMGYRIQIGSGDTGVYLKLKSADIKGRSEEDILRACHAFACVRDGVNCTDFGEVEDYINNANYMSVILDGGVDQAMGRGYAEVMGALSYNQIKRADINGDGLQQGEIDTNNFFIYPFLRNGSVCMPQPMSNLVQNWSRTNETVDCANIRPAIIMTSSNESSIRLVDGRIVVSGSGDSAHTASIILRDIISPEWVRAFHGYN